MIPDAHLQVLVSRDISPGRVVAWTLVRINVNHLSVTFVFKHQASFIIPDDLKIWRCIARRILRIPIEKREIRRLWQQTLCSVENRIPILRLEPVCVVNIARYFLFLRVQIPEEYDRRQLAISHCLLPLRKSLRVDKQT